MHRSCLIPPLIQAEGHQPRGHRALVDARNAYALTLRMDDHNYALVITCICTAKIVEVETVVAATDANT